MCETKRNLFLILGSQGDVCRAVKRIPGELCDKKTQNIIVLSCVELSEKNSSRQVFFFSCVKLNEKQKTTCEVQCIFFHDFFFQVFMCEVQLKNNTFS